jgi:hypothetical protein
MDQPNSVFTAPVQAVDFLAIDGHVQDTCRALAAKLFLEEPWHHSSSECVTTRVRRHDQKACLGSCLVSIRCGVENDAF